MEKVMVYDLVGENAISMTTGSKLYDVIQPKVVNKVAFELDFNGVEIFASPFFNASIGRVLRDVDIKSLQSIMIVSNLSPVGKQLLNLVISNAIKYYGDKKGMISSALDDIKKNIKE